MDTSSNNNCKKKNYGDRINGPWIFGIIEKGTRNMRMFYVENRSAEVLVPLLKAHVDERSTIWSDEWRAYSRLNEHFAGHRTMKFLIILLALILRPIPN